MLPGARLRYAVAVETNHPGGGPTSAQRVYRLPRYQVLLAGLCLTALLAFGGGLYYLVQIDDPTLRGEVLLIKAVSLGVALLLLQGAVFCGWWVLRTSRAWRFDDAGVTVSAWWLGKRRVPWSDVTGCSLLANAALGARPKQMVLHRAAGRPLRFSLEIDRDNTLEQTLRDCCPVLPDSGLDLPCRAPGEGPPVVAEVKRYEEHYGRLGIVLAIAGFALLMTLGLVLGVRGKFEQRALEAPGAGLFTTGHVVELDEDDEGRVDARVRFTPQGQSERRLRQSVPGKAIDTIKVGDTLEVRYLPSKPRVARVEAWGPNDMHWGLLVIGSMIVGVTWFALRSHTEEALGRFRVEGDFIANLPDAGAGGGAEDPTSQTTPFQLGRASLPQMVRAFPERHVGPWGLWALNREGGKSSHALDPSAIGKQLEKADIRGEVIVRTGQLGVSDAGVKLDTASKALALCLSTPDAARFARRAGFAGNDPIAEYAVLPAGDDLAPAWLRERLDDGPKDALWTDAQICVQEGRVGPFAPGDRRYAFDRWVGALVEEAWSGYAPETLRDLSWFELLEPFEDDPASASASCRVLLERADHELRVWREAANGDIRLVTYSDSGWKRIDGLRPPAMLRSGSLLGCLMMLVLAPVAAFAVPAKWLISLPTRAWSERALRGRIVAAAGVEPPQACPARWPESV